MVQTLDGLFITFLYQSIVALTLKKSIFENSIIFAISPFCHEQLGHIYSILFKAHLTSRLFKVGVAVGRVT